MTNLWILGLSGDDQESADVAPPCPHEDNSRLGVRLGTLLLGDNLTANDELADVVLLRQVEELADLGGSLGTKTLGLDGVSQAGDVGLTLLDDDEGEGGDVRADDAAADGLSSALAFATGAVARVALRKEKAGTGGEKDTLLHCALG